MDTPLFLSPMAVLSLVAFPFEFGIHFVAYYIYVVDSTCERNEGHVVSRATNTS